jgi:type IX secretion system PorP/SprF family membrane protein
LYEFIIFTYFTYQDKSLAIRGFLRIKKEKMKKILISAVGIVMSFGALAQYLPQVSYFMHDNLRTNAGSAGSMDMVCINAIYRDQMVGFTGNPQTLFLNAEAPFSLFGTKHGAGFSLYSDEIGFNQDIYMKLSYAFRFNIGDGTLGIGVDGGFIYNTLKDYKWVTSDGRPGDDTNIPDAKNPDDMTFTLGAGLFYRSEDIYFGLSALNLNTPEVITTQTDGISQSIYNLRTQYYVTAGYNMQLSNPAWEIKPAVLLKSDLVVTDIDLNLTCVYNKKIWGGVSYRTGEAVIGMFGLTIMEALRLGIAYDFQTSALMQDTPGTYELMLNYCFKIGVEKAPQKYRSIRFL